MYPIPPNEHLIELRTCRQCSMEFPITDKDMEFYEKVSPRFGSPLCEEGGSLEGNGNETGDLVSEIREQNPPPRTSAPPFQRRFTIPPPTLCPDCRQQRRLAFRNERKLYKRKCDVTGKDIISVYSQDKPYTVYHQDYWWSDAWDSMSYGREFDFPRSALEQFGELMKVVPRMALVEFNNENSSYSNFVTSSRDIYLSTDIFESSKIIYSSTLKKTHNSLELLDVTDSENCYECTGSLKLYNCQHCLWSEECTDSIYLYDCHNVEKSMFCIGLRNKKFHILNKEVTESEYIKIKKSLQNGELSHYEDTYSKLLKEYPRKGTNMILCEDSTGDILNQTKRSKSCFQSTHIEDCSYVVVGYDMTDCMDTTIHNPECYLSYEAFSGGKLKLSCFNILAWIGTHLFYTDNCFSCSHLFLCTGLRNKSYCILNRQYTKEEYEESVPRIIEKMMADGEWGEFFPASMSPFGYNETVVQEYFPLSREEVLKKAPFGKELSEVKRKTEDLEKQEISPPFGHPSFKRGLYFNWSDYEAPFPQVDKVIPASKLPDSIESIPDDILNWAIECEVSLKPFRIIKQELEFYRKHNLPIPRRHPDVRHMDRMKQRNPRKLFERLCDSLHCEDNWKKKGVILKEGENAGYPDLQKNPPVSSVDIPPSKGGLRKMMITTYSPERPETVYCEECYLREVIS